MFKRPALPSLLLFFPLLAGVAAASVCLTGCSRANSVQINYQMGDRVTDGPVVYNIVQTVWKTQLGDLFKMRTPENRFLLITLSATNGGGKELSVPFFALEGPNGTVYRELESGEGVDNWFGLLRTIQPAETRQGNLVFDVPLTSYRLRLTDGGDPGTEKFVWVDIPLHLETDTSVSVPTPGQQ